MNFLERERRRAVAQRELLFADPGQGIYAGRPREFVLSAASANLWEGIRADAIAYFRANNIAWWKGANNEPTGHLLSSQIACVNHLFPVRQRADLATAVLRSLDPEVAGAEVVDDGYVEFEFIGDEQYLTERGFSRGAHCTSIDAFMIGRTFSGERRAFLIEWKYTETYGRQDKYIPARALVYDKLVSRTDSPFKPIDPRDMYFEPFYQLMRQTLLGWQLCDHKDHGCTSYRHIHVVPAQNEKLRLNVTAPTLSGATVSEAWCAVLKQPDSFITTTPVDLLRSLAGASEARALFGYLSRRYWADD